MGNSHENMVLFNLCFAGIDLCQTVQKKCCAVKMWTHQSIFYSPLCNMYQNRMYTANIRGPRREKTYLRRFSNNTGADQPAHQRRQISAFVIRLLEIHIFLIVT